MKSSLVILLLGAVLSAVVADDEYKAPSLDKKYDGYFQYANIPGDQEYEFGYNRGNPSHYTSRYEQSKDSRFRTKVKWADSYDGYGEQYWEYAHSDNYDPAYPAPAYPAPAYPAPAYSAPAYPAPAPANPAPVYSEPASVYKRAQIKF